MILQLFVFSLFFLVFGIISIIKKKKIIGVLFILLGMFVLVLGLVIIYLYPQTLPF